MKYVYPAVFTLEKDGYSVRFPDVEGCYTAGESLEEAIDMAKDALCLMMYNKEKDKKTIPKATEANKIKHGKNEFVSLVKCDTKTYKRIHMSKSVKKTLTIPEWLNEEAKANNLNFSKILQEALIEALLKV